MREQGPIDTAPDQTGAIESDPAEHAAQAPDGSLFEDVSALIEDGKTYLAAESQFQKTRLRYAGSLGGKLAAYGAGALLAVFLLLIAFTVGLLLALAPLVTVWGATAVVILLWVAVAAFCGLKLRATIRKLSATFRSEPKA